MQRLHRQHDLSRHLTARQPLMRRVAATPRIARLLASSDDTQGTLPPSGENARPFRAPRTLTRSLVMPAPLEVTEWADDAPSVRDTSTTSAEQSQAVLAALETATGSDRTPLPADDIERETPLPIYRRTDAVPDATARAMPDTSPVMQPPPVIRREIPTAPTAPMPPVTPSTPTTSQTAVRRESTIRRVLPAVAAKEPTAPTPVVPPIAPSTPVSAAEAGAAATVPHTATPDTVGADAFSPAPTPPVAFPTPEPVTITALPEPEPPTSRNVDRSIISTVSAPTTPADVASSSQVIADAPDAVMTPATAIPPTSTIPRTTSAPAPELRPETQVSAPVPALSVSVDAPPPPRIATEAQPPSAQLPPIAEIVGAARLRQPPVSHRAASPALPVPAAPEIPEKSAASVAGDGTDNADSADSAPADRMMSLIARMRALDAPTTGAEIPSTPAPAPLSFADDSTYGQGTDAAVASVVPLPATDSDMSPIENISVRESSPATTRRDAELAVPPAQPATVPIQTAALPATTAPIGETPITPPTADDLFLSGEQDRSPRAWAARLGGPPTASPFPETTETNSAPTAYAGPAAERIHDPQVITPIRTAAPPIASTVAAAKSVRGTPPLVRASVTRDARPMPTAPTVPPSSRPSSAPPTPLPEAVRHFLAPVVGIDPAEVPVRRDADAHAAASAYRADAITDGATIALAPGNDALESPRTLGLIAHELTHIARRRDPLFVPPVLRARGTAPASPLSTSDIVTAQPESAPDAGEEAIALRVENRVIRAARAFRPGIERAGESSLPEQKNTSTAHDMWADEIDLRAVPPAPIAAAEDPWGGLPMPWEPLPDWLTDPNTGNAPTAQPTAIAAIAAPAPMTFAAMSDAAPAFTDAAPAIQRAGEERGTEAEGEPATVTPTPPEHAPTEPDLDALSRQVYAILKRRLAAERRSAR